MIAELHVGKEGLHLVEGLMDAEASEIEGVAVRANTVWTSRALSAFMGFGFGRDDVGTWCIAARGRRMRLPRTSTSTIAPLMARTVPFASI